MRGHDTNRQNQIHRVRSRRRVKLRTKKRHLKRKESDPVWKSAANYGRLVCRSALLLPSPRPSRLSSSAHARLLDHHNQHNHHSFKTWWPTWWLTWLPTRWSTWWLTWRLSSSEKRTCSIARPTQPPGTVHAVDGVLCYLCLFIQIEKRYYPLFLEIRTYVQPPPPPVYDHIFRCVCINKHPILDTCVLAHKMCVFPSFTTNITGKQMVDGGDLQCFRFGRGYRSIMCIELHIFVFSYEEIPSSMILNYLLCREMYWQTVNIDAIQAFLVFGKIPSMVNPPTPVVLRWSLNLNLLWIVKLPFQISPPCRI